MSFIFTDTLNDDITLYLYGFTRPKNPHDYNSVIYLTNFIKPFFLKIPIEMDVFLSETLSISTYEFSQFIGFQGYGLYLGMIDNGNNVFLVFNQFPLIPTKIITVNQNKQIIYLQHLSENNILAGFISKSNYFNYTYQNVNKSNPSEIRHWNTFINNTTEYVNKYMDLHLNGKLVLNYIHIDI